MLKSLVWGLSLCVVGACGGSGDGAATTGASGATAGTNGGGQAGAAGQAGSSGVGGAAGALAGGSAGQGTAGFPVGAAGNAGGGNAGASGAGAGGTTAGGASGAGGGPAGAGGANGGQAGAAGQAGGQQAGAAGQAGGPQAGAAGQAGAAQTDPYSYLYQSGDNYVRFRPVANVLEKVSGAQRDVARQMMPIDLHTWSIANFNRSLLMFTHFKLRDAAGTTLFEINDLEGAVHVALAQNAHETDRGNNHQPQLSDFLIATGSYEVELSVLPGSLGKPSLMLWRQREGNLFLVLVGAAPSGQEQSSVSGPDGLLVNVGETVTRGFTVTFVDEPNAIYKSNANGFEPL